MKLIGSARLDEGREVFSVLQACWQAGIFGKRLEIHSKYYVSVIR